MNPKITKKHAIVLVVALIALFIIIVGGSYAFFTNTVRGKEYVIYSGTLAVSYEKKTNVVNLNNTKPMTNTEGLATTAYSFDVKNTGTIEEKYQVRLEEDTNNTLPLEYVKISVYKNDTELLKPTKLSELSTNLVIGEGELDSLDSDNYKVRLWVDINTPNDMVGKEFKARVVIDAMQNVEEGFAVDTKPIITLNKDSNNNTNLLLNVGDTYTELGVESVRDDKDTISTNSVAISGTVNTNVAGIYTVTYSVTDSDNNTSTVTRTVAVNDGSLPVYKGISNVLASFTQEELTNNETVICDHIYGDGDLYFNCEVKNTLANAFAARTESSIILTKDVATNQINIYNKVILNLNGKKITPAGSGQSIIFYVMSGDLTINGDGMLYDNYGTSTSNGAIKIWGSENSRLVFNGNQCNDTDPENFTSGLLIYSANGYTVANYGIKTNADTNATIEVNGGCYVSKSANRGGLQSAGNTTLTINDAYINTTISPLTAIQNGIINIKGGTIIGETSAAIRNDSNGIINIIQTDKPIYISSLAQEFKPAISNWSNGIINITANSADACTSDPASTTSGLCVYAEGDGNFAASTANGAVMNGSNGSTININGGTYFGGHQGINNNADGTVNIKNAIITSRTTILNNNAGAINICSSNLNRTTYDIYNSKTGVITYNDITVTNATPNIFNPNGTVTQVATCPIVD